VQILKNYLHIINLIRACRETENMEKQIELLQSIDRLLPIGYKLRLPSFITNDYIDSMLNALEEKITE
jgi:hypothetical protein